MFVEIRIVKWVFAMFILSSIVAGKAAHAQGPPLNTDTPIFLGLEGRGLRTFGKFVSKENSSIYAQPIALPYNITTKIFVGVIAPFIRISPDGLKSQSGIGDISLFSKILLYQKDGLGKTFRIALKIQETFPTGDTDNNPAIGLGAYQTQIGLISAYITRHIGVYGELGYKAIGDHINDKLIYNFAFGLPILPPVYPPKQFNIYLEINGSTVLKSKNNAHTIFLSPGIQVIPNRRFLIESGLQIPLKEDVPSAQKTNFIFTLGTRILIF